MYFLITAKLTLCNTFHTKTLFPSTQIPQSHLAIWESQGIYTFNIFSQNQGAASSLNSTTRSLYPTLSLTWRVLFKKKLNVETLLMYEKTQHIKKTAHIQTAGEDISPLNKPEMQAANCKKVI